MDLATLGFRPGPGASVIAAASVLARAMWAALPADAIAWAGNMALISSLYARMKVCRWVRVVRWNRAAQVLMYCSSGIVTASMPSSSFS